MVGVATYIHLQHKLKFLLPCVRVETRTQDDAIACSQTTTPYADRAKKAPPHVYRRAGACSAVTTGHAVGVPADVLLEIAARSDTRTLVRCAALCKPLRRDILSPAFLRRVTGQQNPADRIVLPCLLGYLHTYDKEKKDMEEVPTVLFSVIHPDPAAGSHHLAPSIISRSAAAATDLLGAYEPITSRGGLIVLGRRHVNRRRRSERRSDMCVYNPMTGERTFFSYPPDYWNHYHLSLGNVFVPLTAKDGIGCVAFMLLVVDLSGFSDCRCTIRVQTIMSSDVTWSPVTYVGDVVRPWWWLDPLRDAVVLPGGLIHWLAHHCRKILTYDVGTSKPGSIDLPVVGDDASKLHLGLSPDRRLRLLVAGDASPSLSSFMVSVWLLSAGGGWELAAVMDTEEKLRALDPEIPPRARLKFVSSGERSGTALLWIPSSSGWNRGWLIVLDVETGEVRKIGDRPNSDSLLVEVDLLSRLRTMKNFL